jgi:signal transduction histidine kinase
MKIRVWWRDTIARRIVLAIFSAAIITVALGGLFVEFAGVWARPSEEFDTANYFVRLIEAAPASDRPALVRALTLPTAIMNWYPGASAVSTKLDASVGVGVSSRMEASFQSGGLARSLVAFRSENPLSLGLSFGGISRSDAYFLAAKLNDSSWVVFTASRTWGLDPIGKFGVAAIFLGIFVIASSTVATYHLTRPLRQFTEGVRRSGADRRAPPIPEVGPQELRATIREFNAMQAQIRKFVEDRTIMLAAISHDLRTPLTKIRLRGEFIEDDVQRACLFRDVEELQAMADSALGFFRDDFKDENSTDFDFPALLRTIVDDCGDQGTVVVYAGPDQAVFHGRPFALKRACTNLIGNAVKYGKSPEVELQCSAQRFVLVISDRGPGIPLDALEKVFTPFFRLEQSRNSMTGGVGLGLTSARAVIRGHGGEIALCNRAGGGLEVRVTLPVVS